MAFLRWCAAARISSPKSTGKDDFRGRNDAVRELRLFHFANIMTHHVDAIFLRIIEDYFALGGGNPISGPMMTSLEYPRHAQPARETLP
jgi:hypothetical protein